MHHSVAPMEGLTDRVWRQAHWQWFGGAGAPDRYYAPFLSPPENRVLDPPKNGRAGACTKSACTADPAAAGQGRGAGRLDQSASCAPWDTPK